MLADTERLMGTVEQVLKATQLGQKRGLQHSLEVDLGSLTQECVELVRVRYNLPGDAMHFQTTSQGASASVLGDPEELRIAVTNVLDNAVKYSGSHVDVGVELDTHDPSMLELRVQDHGVGIPKNDLKRVFRRFYRSTTRSNIKGTGLGLFIVHSIVDKHGGRVSAESPGEGKGTTVTIQIPRIYAH